MKNSNLQKKRNKQLKQAAKRMANEKVEIEKINQHASEVRHDISESSFFFRTSLKPERIQGIVTFFNSLTPDQQRMMNEYREDGMENQAFDDSESNWNLS